MWNMEESETVFVKNRASPLRWYILLVFSLHSLQQVRLEKSTLFWFRGVAYRNLDENQKLPGLGKILLKFISDRDADTWKAVSPVSLDTVSKAYLTLEIALWSGQFTGKSIPQWMVFNTFGPIAFAVELSHGWSDTTLAMMAAVGSASFIGRI